MSTDGGEGYLSDEAGRPPPDLGEGSFTPGKPMSSGCFAWIFRTQRESDMYSRMSLASGSNGCKTTGTNITSNNQALCDCGPDRQHSNQTTSQPVMGSSGSRPSAKPNTPPRGRPPTEGLVLLKPGIRQEDHDDQPDQAVLCPFPSHVLNTRPTLSFVPENDVKIHRLLASIDKRLTSIDERSAAVLKYRTPHFRACAQVELPALAEDDCIEVGWIQACLHMRFINSYGNDGVTSWEFPEIILRNFQMVSDADGKQYPWYGAKHEVFKFTGPCAKQIISVEMNDNFFPQVTWYVPDDSYDRTPRLSHIHRKQEFYTFLALRNFRTKQLHVLKTVTWKMELNISVDPNKPLGVRAKLLGPKDQEQPRILEKNIQVPRYALKPPNANNSQTLIWRPHAGIPRVIVPPVETTVVMEKYLLATRALGGQYTSIERES